MPLCGFNEKMLEGLEMFHLSLVENKIIDKPNKDMGELEND